MSTFRSLFMVAVLLAASMPALAQAASERDYTKFDVCKAVPGETVAHALGGKIVRTRPFSDKSFSRCTYFVQRPGSDQPAGYSVWIEPPGDFEDLKAYIEEPITMVNGLGDGAYTFQDKGDGRFKMNVLKKGDLMFHVVADSPETLRKIADAVVGVLWKTSR